MKTKLFTTALCMFLLSIPMFLNAQPGGGHRHDRNDRDLQQVTAFSGKITDWSYNDDFIYDGFYLSSNGQSYLVKFPSHLGQQVRSLGNDVTVNGVQRYSREGEQSIRMVNIQAGGKTVYDNKPVRKDTPPVEQFINGKGKVTQLQINRRGDVSGYILDNNIVLRTPRRVAGQLSQQVQIGTTIEYTGVEKKIDDGQVAAKNYMIVRCQTISVNGTQYLVR